MSAVSGPPPCEVFTIPFAPGTGLDGIAYSELALLLGQPVEELVAEAELQRATMGPAAGFTIPHAWMERGQQVRAEAEAATGSDDMHAVIAYLRDVYPTGWPS